MKNVTTTISEADQELVKLQVAKLGEHFDSVRVFVSRHSGTTTDTASFEYGLGNFYAQLGQIQEWLTIQDQFTRCYAIRKDGEDELPTATIEPVNPPPADE